MLCHGEFRLESLQVASHTKWDHSPQEIDMITSKCPTLVDRKDSTTHVNHYTHLPTSSSKVDKYTPG